MRQETIGFLDGSGIRWTIMQTICTSLQTDNHTNTSSFNFYRPDALPDAQPKHRRQSSEPEKKVIKRLQTKKQQAQKKRYRGVRGASPEGGKTTNIPCTWPRQVILDLGRFKPPEFLGANKRHEVGQVQLGVFVIAQRMSVGVRLERLFPGCLVPRALTDGQHARPQLGVHTTGSSQ